MNKILIIGAGYVGLPLKKKLKADSYDLIKSKNDIKKEKDFLKYNVFIFCLPTPIDLKNKPDLNNYKDCLKKISKYFKKNDLIIFESSVTPGTINGIFKDIIEKNISYKKLKICYSPERVSPSLKKELNSDFILIPKLLSSNTKKGFNEAKKIYESIGINIIKSKTIEEAEFSKLMENAQRELLISFNNEMKMLAESKNLNFENILKLAETKPGYIKGYKTGLVGGHCLSVDPYYLLELNNDLKLINSMRNVNEEYINYISNKVKNNSKVLLLGYSYKSNIDDIRNTKTETLKDLLEKKDCLIDIFDDYSFNNKNIKKEYDYIIEINKNFNTLNLNKINYKNYIKC